MKEIFKQAERSTTISITNSEIHSLRNKNISSTGFRVYRDGFIGVAGAQGKCSMADLETKAVDLLKMRIPYGYELCGNKVDKVRKKLLLPEGFQLMQEVQEILNALTASNPDFIYSHQASTHEYETSLQNDLGLDLSYKDNYIALGFVFKEKSSANIMDGYFGYGGREYDREQFIASFLELLKAYKTPAELPMGQDMPVIFGSSSSAVSKLNQDLNGLQIGTGNSLLTQHMGKDTFHKDLTVWQTHNPDDNILQYFDMEGHVNPGYRVKLIDKGKVIQGYTDKKTAAKYNLPYTGCASGTYDAIPKLAGADLYLKPSDKTLKQLLGGKLGIYVYIASGGDSTHTGDFGTPVQLAFLTDGEKLLGRLPELSVGSNLFQMFGSDFIGVSSDKTYVHDFSHYLVMNMKVAKLY